jgi:hypothetical protein
MFLIRGLSHRNSIGLRMITAAAAAIISASLLLTQPATALTTFQTSYTVTAHSSGDGLLINTSLLNTSLTLPLDVGTPFTTPLFKIWTDETSVNAGEDTVAKDIGVTFNFTSPSGTGSVVGSTVGRSFTLFNVINVQKGAVTWTPTPTEFNLGGAILAVTLSDQLFNPGLFGLIPGQRWGAIVTGTFTLLSLPPDSGPSPVPLPGALVLMGSVVAGSAGFARWRRRRSSHAVAA